jgi:hypothetical protein
VKLQATSRPEDDTFPIIRHSPDASGESDAPDQNRKTRLRAAKAEPPTASEAAVVDSWRIEPVVTREG